MFDGAIIKEMKKYKFDILIIAFIVVFSGVLFWIFNKSQNIDSGLVEVYVDGVLEHSFDINKDIIYDIDSRYGTNTLEIKNKKVSIIRASCKDKICVNQGSINNYNQPIICLPNRVEVRLINEDNNIDGYAY